MIAKLVSIPESDVPITYMKDGDVALITKWDLGNYEGRIVQRIGSGEESQLITIGGTVGEHFSFIFKKDILDSTRNNCKVKILPEGTIIRL